MWEYCQSKVLWRRRRNKTTIRPCQKGRRGTKNAYVWMDRMKHLIASGTIEKVRKIVLLPGSMQEKVLKRAIATIARSEAKSAIQLAAIQLCSQPHMPSLSN